MINPKAICNSCIYKSLCEDAKRNIEIIKCNMYKTNQLKQTLDYNEKNRKKE